jgi:hypothetical protein
VAPPAWARIVARAGLAALGAACIAPVLDDHLDLGRRHVKAHVSDVPGRVDSKDLGVQAAVSHATTVETAATPADGSSGPIYPHGFPKTPPLNSFSDTPSEQQS